MFKLFAHPGFCILTTYLLVRRGSGPQTFIFGWGSKKCYRLTTDLPKRFLINNKLKSASIIF